MTMINLHNDQTSRISLRQVFTELIRIPANAVVTMELWAARASQRRQLASLDGSQISDIGRSFCDVQQESSKPFWKK